MNIAQINEITKSTRSQMKVIFQVDSKELYVWDGITICYVRFELKQSSIGIILFAPSLDNKYL